MTLLFTENELRRSATTERLQKNVTTASVLRESRKSTRSSFDVFLSHSRMDSELVHGAKARLESYGLNVYVDWIDDPLLDRSNVTPQTARQLKIRMDSSLMLVYAHTMQSSVSKWCPWELGYFDGKRGGNVFLLPIVQGDDNEFKGQEYLGLYPYIDHVGNSIYVNGSRDGLKQMKEALTKVVRSK